MSKESPIKHIIRRAPSWSTCDPVTLCGNATRSGDMTIDEALAYIRAECRGSTHVAYGTCCVTCVQGVEYRQRYGVNPEMGLLLDYIEKLGRGRDERAKTISSELRALEQLVQAHRDEFIHLVETATAREEWLKLKQSDRPGRLS